MGEQRASLRCECGLTLQAPTSAWPRLVLRCPPLCRTVEVAQLREVKHSTQGLRGTWLWGYWGFSVDSVLSSWGWAVSPSQSLMTVPSPAYATLFPLHGKEPLHHACTLAVAAK